MPLTWNGDPDRNTAMGFEHLSSGRLDEAASAFWSALETDEELPSAEIGLAAAFVQKGDTENALSCLRGAIARILEDPKELLELGLACHRIGHPADACILLEKALRYSQDNLDALLALGECWQELEEWDRASMCFRRALEICPDNAEACLNAGLVQIKQGRRESAIQSFRRAAELAPQNPDAYLNLGFALLDDEKWNEARDSFVKAQMNAGDDPLIKASLARALFRSGDACGAEKLVQEVESDPIVNGHVAYVLGCFYTDDLGDPAKGIAFFERAVAIDPDSREAFAGIVRAAMELEDADAMDRALGEGLAGLEANPESGASAGWPWESPRRLMLAKSIDEYERGAHESQSKPASFSEAGRVYQLRIRLRIDDPPIWRRVLVPADVSMHQLHRIIETAVGWSSRADHFYDVCDPAHEETTVLGQAAPAVGSKIQYVYDTEGDQWWHDILVEKVLPNETTLGLPVCISGVGACPAEDVGGMEGYSRMLLRTGRSKKSGPKDVMSLIGDFNPYDCPIDAINEALRRRILPDR